MSSVVDEFVQDAPGVNSAESHHKGECIHVYRGQLDGRDGTVRFLTLSPDIDEIAVEEAFMQVAGEWQSASTNPNIVAVYERSDTPRPWVATADVAGQPLDAAQPNLVPAEMQTVVMDVAEAIRNAALYNTAHGALSPECIFVAPAEDGVAVSVDDWGLRQAVRTAAGSFEVTPFTAPELLDDPAATTEQTDVYGLGAIAYYTLTGVPPISGASIEASIREGNMAPPSDYVETLSEVVDEGVLRALAVNPSDRYESAYAFKRAFVQAYTVEDTETEEETATGAVAAATDADNNTPGESDVEDTSTLTTRRAALAMVGIVGVGGGWMTLTQLGGDDTDSSTAAQSTETQPQDDSATANDSESTASEPADAAGEQGVWPQSGYGPQNHAVNRAGLAQREEPTEQWRFETGWEVRGNPVVRDDQLYFTSKDGNLYNLDATTGSEQWRYETSDTGWTSPALKDDLVMFTSSRDQTLYALDAETGSLSWEFETNGNIWRSPKVVDDTVYFGSNDQNLYAVDVATGTERWRATTNGAVLSVPAVGNDSVLFTSRDDNLYCVEQDTGDEIWAVQASFQTDPLIGTPTIVDGTVIQSGRGGPNRGYDIEDGSMRWESDVRSGGGTIYDGMLLHTTVESETRTLQAVAPSSGDIEWTLEDATSGNVTGDTLYYTRRSGRFGAVDLVSRSKLWERELDTDIKGNPLVVNEWVYLSGADSYLYAYQ